MNGCFLEMDAARRQSEKKGMKMKNQIMAGFLCWSLLTWSVADSKVKLPPVIEFNGKSLELMAQPDDPWMTPAEQTGLTDSPAYLDTTRYLKKLVAASDSLEMRSLGKSREGRDIWMVIASNQGLFQPEAIRQSGKPVFLIQAGIHAGEIDGKDAGLMLLRDMTVAGRKRHLLDDIVVLFIPILNVDGHERRSEFNRINQRGPLHMGWRTNAGNLNLNRDYAKADTEGIRAVLKCIRDYQPVLYYDIHVTDGIDYQYDITFGGNGVRGFSPESGQYLYRTLFPQLRSELASWGHIPGPLVFAADKNDMSKGIVRWFAGPRYSTGYGDLAHVPTVLVENHSLKPYRQRVLGTYILLEATLAQLQKTGHELQTAIQKDQQRRTKRVPFKYDFREKNPTIAFLAIQSEKYHSRITGTEETRWLGKPETITIPYRYRDRAVAYIQKPKAYWVPAGWHDVIDRLQRHGIQMELIDKVVTQTLTAYRFEQPEYGKAIFEGHFRVNASFIELKREMTFQPGSVRVPLDQPLGDLAVNLLDPRFPDSFFQWGFFNQIFQRTEYTEAYAIIPHAEDMLKDPIIKQAFETKLKEDEAFRNNRRARLYWFYEKTPYYDQQWKLYPVGIEP
ncbi:MAG: carboxypeptidase [Acidobacteria bacterium]|nr:MAG: carboxypeptidase [Acidobacteriota bacterium]PIE91082.1 MAG: carboxypeptidase [Acidobacteriota bacterium]